METRIATIFAILSMVISTMAFSSCEKDEDCDYFMAWSFNGEPVREIVDFYSPTDSSSSHFDSWISVDPIEESSYTFVCTNTYFTKVKITSLKCDGTAMDITEENPQFIEGDWFTIDLDGMEMTVSFKPNDTDKERTLYIGVHSADGKISVGYGFTFTQAAQNETESDDLEE